MAHHPKGLVEDIHSSHKLRIMCLYPGEASVKNIIHHKTTPLHFKEMEDTANNSFCTLCCPSANIMESITEYSLSVAAPGLLPENLCIESENGVIHISAIKEIEKSDNSIDRFEYNYSNWTRSFTLPEDADIEMAYAKYRNGELIIRIPRSLTAEYLAKTKIYVY